MKHPKASPDRLVLCLALLTVLFFSAFAGLEVVADDSSDDTEAAPSRRVIACYFHRTQRCPSCITIGQYVEEAISIGYADEVEAGELSILSVDYQAASSARYVQAYKVTGPKLIVIEVEDGKVLRWKDAPKVWTLIGDKDAFIEYVQGELKVYVEPAEESEEDVDEE
jgi:hypothetical protein